MTQKSLLQQGAYSGRFFSTVHLTRSFDRSDGMPVRLAGHSLRV
jgi:hypothetical protein